MENVLKEYGELTGRQVVEELNKHGFTAEYVSDAVAARTRLLELIPPGVSVGFGGSMTIAKLDVKGALTEKGCTLFDHAGILDQDEAMKIRRQQVFSDVFLTSTNAITKDGALYNVDGRGNRVAAMIFGPKEVILVAGINKIVPDLAAAEERVCQIAGPMNNLRLHTGNPCTKTGECMDCASSKRICNAAVILHQCPTGAKFRVIIVGEALGF